MPLGYNTSTGVYVGSENLGALTTSGNADDGEYLKVDLGSAVQANTLTLKSVLSYKEPRINMSDYNQCGYEVTASSENSATSPVYLAFNNLTTPDSPHSSHRGEARPGLTPSPFDGPSRQLCAV